MPPFKNELLLFIAFLLTINAPAQTDLRKDKAFIKEKKQEYNLWLQSTGLNGTFVADSVAVSAGKATIFLLPTFIGSHVCDSTQAIWQALQTQYQSGTGQDFADRLLSKWAFIAEVKKDQAEVIVGCHRTPHFRARIFQEGNTVPVETRTLRSALMSEVTLQEHMTRDISVGDNAAVLMHTDVEDACRMARAFFIQYYKNKGTPVMWRARIDSSYAFEDEFILEVTRLSYEICPDGYFEYHRIWVKGKQMGENTELKWEFEGKYGSGILFPPRKNNYKDLQTHYKKDLETYQNQLFKRLIDYLRRR